VQEIFIELWKTAGRFDPAKASEATFITLIARRRLIDRKRRSGSRPVAEPLMADPVGDLPEPITELTRHDESARAMRFLGELPVEQQRVMKLALLGGLTHDEIARQTGLPLGTVKTQIRRGLIDVRERMQSATARRDGGAR
jgi:RNA polymerase sigma factor (sigma-70 family)